MSDYDAQQGILNSLWGIKQVNESRAAETRSLLLTALQTDGEHHKQWYLCEILKMFMTEEEYDAVAGSLFEEGIAP